MSLDVLTFGLNHTSAPVALRERVSFSGDVLRPELEGLRSAFGRMVREAAILSTCNRTELYFADQPEISEHIPDWLADFNELTVNCLLFYIYRSQQFTPALLAFRCA